MAINPNVGRFLRAHPGIAMDALLPGDDYWGTDRGYQWNVSHFVTDDQGNHIDVLVHASAGFPAGTPWVAANVGFYGKPYKDLMRRYRQRAGAFLFQLKPSFAGRVIGGTAKPVLMYPMADTSGKLEPKILNDLIWGVKQVAAVYKKLGAIQTFPNPNQPRTLLEQELTSLVTTAWEDETTRHHADLVGLADADQRRMDALVGAALRRQGQPRRRGDDHEARILVAGVVQRIEAAGDEGIVERADRQQARAEQLMAEAQRRQLDEQVVLGDAELDVLAARRLAPQLGRHDLEFAEHVLGLGMGPQAAPVGNDEKEAALGCEDAPDFRQHLLGAVGEFDAMGDENDIGHAFEKREIELVDKGRGHLAFRWPGNHPLAGEHQGKAPARLAGAVLEVGNGIA